MKEFEHSRIKISIIHQTMVTPHTHLDMSGTHRRIPQIIFNRLRMSVSKQ